MSESSQCRLEEALVRFKLDENLPTEAVQFLQEAGLDAVSVLDQDLGGQRDTLIAEVCRTEGRILLTFDTDFANIRAYPPENSAGLVVFRLRTQETEYLLKMLERFLMLLREHTPTGQLWVVDESRLRIRE
ncbi:MAG: DUF5615 family PIN-like protein [Acidobacteriota bacterium]|nr:DUF5615 family PIN-like protein [Acidobacteriota bacterium]